MLRKLLLMVFWLVTAAGIAINAVWAVVDAAWRQDLLLSAALFAWGAVMLSAGVGLGLLWKRLLFGGDDRHDPD